ncbi:hypothetical protein, partial [Pseudoalteromonas sp.]|uniref:hypothetical protein n=1 Tax=Pseudoalteromonas sp. TaxID=53249 RepID=UPI00257EE156
YTCHNHNMILFHRAVFIAHCVSASFRLAINFPLRYKFMASQNIGRGKPPHPQPRQKAVVAKSKNKSVK